MIRLCLKKVRSEVESSDSVDLQVTWGVVRSELPGFPGLQQSSIKLNLCISFFVSTLLSVSVDQDVWIELFHSSWPFTCMEMWACYFVHSVKILQFLLQGTATN